MRGIERWAEHTAAGEAWFARVETEDGSTTTLTKVEYDARNVSPDFWSLRKQRRSYSDLVAAGMKRVCADFTFRVAPLGFKKTGARRWGRTRGGIVDAIWIERAGSSYGSPINSSVDLRIWLAVWAANAAPEKRLSLRCEQVRRPDGRAYHHRFNAETFSTYDRCLEELTLFLSEFAEGWFEQQAGSITTGSQGSVSS